MASLGLSHPLPFLRDDRQMDSSQNLQAFSSSGALGGWCCLFPEWHHGQCPLRTEACLALQLGAGSSPGHVLPLPCGSMGRPVAQLTVSSPAWASCMTLGPSEDLRHGESPGWCLCARVCTRVCMCTCVCVSVRGPPREKAAWTSLCPALSIIAHVIDLDLPGR